MPDIILKNILGQDVTYTGIDTVKLKNTAGGEETFSHGIAMENVPIELDLANGEQQTIYAPDGTLVKSAVVSITGGGGGDAVEMEETELPFAAADGAYQSVLPITRLFFNATYTVMWNGTEYSCTCKAMEFADSLVLTVGNAAFLGGEAEDVPFLIVQTPDIVGCITLEANATNTVGLTLNFEAGGGESARIDTTLSKIITLTGTSAPTIFTADELTAAGIDPAEIVDEAYNSNSKYVFIMTLTRIVTTMPTTTNNLAFMVTTTVPLYIYNNRYSFNIFARSYTSNYSVAYGNNITTANPFTQAQSNGPGYYKYNSDLRISNGSAVKGTYVATIMRITMK